MYIEDTGTGDGDMHVATEGHEDAAAVTDDGFVDFIDGDLGQWHGDLGLDVLGDPGHPDHADHPTPGPVPPHAPAPQPMTIDTPHGAQQVGPPTEDTGNTGRPDTAIVPTARGMLLATDVNGTGSADQVLEITNNGDVTVSRHTGPGQWTVVQHGQLDQSGQYQLRPIPPAPTDDSTWSFDAPAPASDQPPASHGGYQAPDPSSDSVWV